MKRYRSYIFAVLLAAVFLGGSIAWYYGFIPILAGDDRSALRQALNLTVLPIGTTINVTGEVWFPDYFFEADISINPSRFEKLMAGRNFKRLSIQGFPDKASAHLIKGYHGFPISEIWSWSEKIKDVQGRDFGPSCTLFTNKTHDRVFVLVTEGYY